MTKVSHKLLERACEIVPELRAQSSSIEEQRRVPQATADKLAELGMFRMLVPKKLRGFEVQPRVFVDVLRELARGDAACAWHVMTGATNGVLSAYLPPDAASAIWAENPRVITAGVFAPAGRAQPMSGGYRLSGRWPFASGCENAGWLMGGGLVARVENDKPEIRSFLFPASEARVLDTWDVSGLCGTGSHHIEVVDAFVPEERTCMLTVDRPLHDGPLYRFPVFGLLAAGVAAVGLGIARAAVDAFVDLATTKKSFGGGRTLAHGEYAQREVAGALGELLSGEAILLSACDEAYEAAENGDLEVETRAHLRLSATQATLAAVRAVDRMYHAGGGTAL
jgi:alkylation response protein AidB-like acyl-CoA dehydrogenase